MSTARDEIVVLQNPIYQCARATHANANFSMARPLARRADRWIIERIRSHIATDSDGLGQDFWDPCASWAARYSAGAYYGEGANEDALPFSGWGAWAAQ